MRKRTPTAYSTDPHIQFLSQVLTDIENGQLLVPRFQRPRVWDVDRRLELLRSIREGIPVGSIMVWRTRSNPIQCYDHIGPYPLNIRKDLVPHQYILDGVQRLSTLYGALKTHPTTPALSEESEDEDEEYQTTFFDLEDEEFFESTVNAPSESALPLDILFDSVELLRFQRRLQGPRADVWIERADALAKAFREYKIPIIPISTDSLELATLTFQRINSQGAVMSDFHMLHALTWSNDFDLQRDLRTAREEILTPLGWGELDEDPIMKTCKAALDVDLYKVEIEDLSSGIKARPQILRESVHTIARAAQFLKDMCAAGLPDAVPYSLQIVLLAEVFRLVDQRQIDEDLLERLEHWFWLTTYTEAFTGISDDRVRVGLEDVRDLARNGVCRWRLLPPAFVFEPRKRFDFRSARSKALTLTLARLRDAGTPKDGTTILSEYGRRAVVQLVPSRELRHSPFQYSSPGNRVLVRPTELAFLRQHLMSGKADDVIDATHGITPHAREALKERDYVAFIRIRNNHLHEVEANVLVAAYKSLPNNKARLSVELLSEFD